MAKHPDYVLKNNAKRGAVTTWCPNCKRKSALGQDHGAGRRCRYCKHHERRPMGDRRALYNLWLLDSMPLDKLRQELREENKYPGLSDKRASLRRAIGKKMGIDMLSPDSVLLGETTR